MKYVSLAVLTVLCTLSACSSRDSLEGRGPDEYLTMSNPPLILPPDFTLRAPVAAEKNALTTATPAQKQVEKALHAPAAPTNIGDGERALLRKTGTGDADIRKTLENDEKNRDETTPVLDKALKPNTAETTVDAEKEAANLQGKGIKTTGKKADE